MNERAKSKIEQKTTEAGNAQAPMRIVQRRDGEAQCAATTPSQLADPALDGQELEGSGHISPMER